MNVVSNWKQCNQCLEWKWYTDFHKDHHMVKLRLNTCKECQKDKRSKRAQRESELNTLLRNWRP